MELQAEEVDLDALVEIFAPAEETALLRPTGGPLDALIEFWVGTALAAQQLSVQVREAKLRQRPSYLGATADAVAYGTRVEVLETRGRRGGGKRRLFWHGLRPPGRFDRQRCRNPPGQITRIKATFDKPGRYVWHCHILSHEDHEMMRVLHIGKGAHNGHGA